MARGSANNVTENKTRARRGTPTKEIEEIKSAESNDKKTTSTRRNNPPITKVEKKGNKKTDKLGCASTSKTSSVASKSVDTNTVSEQSAKKETSKKNQKNKTSKIVEKVERKRKAENTNEELVEETVDELTNEIVEKRIAGVQNKKLKFDTDSENSQDSKKVMQSVTSRKTRNAKKVEDEDLEQNDAEGMELEEKIDFNEKKEQVETFDDNSQSSTLIKSGTIRKTRSTKKVEVAMPLDPKTSKAEEKSNKKSTKVDVVDDSSQDSLKPIRTGSTRKTRNAKKGEDNITVDKKNNEFVEIRDELNLIENVQKVSTANENSRDVVTLSKREPTRKTRSGNKGEEISNQDLVNETKVSERKDTLIVDTKEIFDTVDESSRDSMSSFKSSATRKTRNVKKAEETVVEQKEKISCNETDLKVDTVDDCSQEPVVLTKSGPTRKTRGAKKFKKNSIERKATKCEEENQDLNENDVKTDTSEESSQDSMKSINVGSTRKTRNSKNVENIDCSDTLKPNVKADSVNDSVEDSIKSKQSGLSKKTRNANYDAENDLVKLETKGLESQVGKGKGENMEQFEEHKDDSNVLVQKPSKDTEVEEAMGDNEQVEIEKYKDKSEVLKQRDSECMEMNIQPQKKGKATIDDNNDIESINPNIDSFYKSSLEKDQIGAIGDISTENVNLDSSQHLESQNTHLSSDKKEIFAESTDVEEKISLEMKVQTEYSKTDSREISSCNFEEIETELSKNSEGNLQTIDKDVQEFNIEHNRNECETVDNKLNSRTIAENQEDIESDLQLDTSQNNMHSEIDEAVAEDSEDVTFEEGNNKILSKVGNNPEIQNIAVTRLEGSSKTEVSGIQSEVIKHSSLDESDNTIEKSLSAEKDLVGEVNTNRRNIIIGEQSVSLSNKNAESEISSESFTELPNFEITNVNPCDVQESKELEITANISEQVNIYECEDEQNDCSSEETAEACLVINMDQSKDETEKKAAESEIVGMISNDNIVNETSSICSKNIGLKHLEVCKSKTDEISAVNSGVAITSVPISADNDQHGVTSKMISDTSDKEEKDSVENVNLESSITDVTDSGAEKSVSPKVDSAENKSEIAEKIEMIAGSQVSIKDSSDDRGLDYITKEILFDSEDTTIDMEDCSNLTEEASITNDNLDSPTTVMADSGTENSTINETDSIGNVSALSEKIKMFAGIQLPTDDSSDGADSKNQEDTASKKIDDFEETKIDIDERKNKSEAISFKNVELESPVIGITNIGQEHSKTQEFIKSSSHADDKAQVDTISKMVREETARNIEGYKDKTKKISAKVVDLDSHIMNMNDSETENATTPESDYVENTSTMTKKFETITESLSTVKSSDDIVDSNIIEMSASLDTHGSVEGQEKISEISEDIVISKAVESIGIISNGTKEKIYETKLDTKSNLNKMSDEVDFGSNNEGSLEDQIKDSSSVLQMPLTISKEADISVEKNEANQIAESSSLSPEDIKAMDGGSHEEGNCEMGIKPKSIKKKKASKKGGKSNQAVDMKVIEKDEVSKRIITTYEVTSNVDSSKKGVKRNATDNEDTTGTEVSLALKIKRKRVEEVESHSVTPSTKKIQCNPLTTHPGASNSEGNTRGQIQHSSADCPSEPGPSGFQPEPNKPSRKRKRTSAESATHQPENSAAPVRMYLERFVPFLLEGLLKITYVRPDDPIQYLADWMKENKEAAYSSMKNGVPSD